jgi:hypothetical protein
MLKSGCYLIFLSIISGIVYGLQWDCSPGYVAVVTNEDGTITRYEVPYCGVKMYHYRLGDPCSPGF